MNESQRGVQSYIRDKTELDVTLGVCSFLPTNSAFMVHSAYKYRNEFVLCVGILPVSLVYAYEGIGISDGEIAHQNPVKTSVFCRYIPAL